jgi:Xaa-Pro aminopeptidase
MNYFDRQQNFNQQLSKGRLNGFIVAHPPNLRYLCGYTGSNGLLLFFGDRPIFFTDGRYTQQAHEEVQGARLVIAKGPLTEAACRAIAPKRPVRIGYEADHTTVVSAIQLRKAAQMKIAWKPISGMIMRQRLIKDAEELRLLHSAVNLGAAVYQEALASVAVGVRESEVAGRLEFAARRGGAEGMSFDTIVAGGKRSALPHGRASNQPLPRRGFVVIDSGVLLNGYCSDMTRTVHIGRPTREERGWYDAVLEAQLAAIAAVKPGVNAGEVDLAARNVLRRAKLDRYFTHSTGHGVGLEIHEPPRLGAGQKEPLQPGMVITIEPGVYLPDRGGIRIEDMVVVTDRGCNVITPLGKELIEI